MGREARRASAWPLSWGVVAVPNSASAWTWRTCAPAGMRAVVRNARKRSPSVVKTSYRITSPNMTLCSYGNWSVYILYLHSESVNFIS